jgi:hypothetical protein
MLGGGDKSVNTKGFAIAILEQGWLAGCSPEGDLCSHGRIRLVIGGQVLSDGDESLGISETALALLRTLESNHSHQHAVADRLIFHGCGAMLMSGCPIGFDWSVTHKDDLVHIADVVRYPTTNEAHAETFNGLHATVTLAEYRKEVTRFAAEAKSLFAGVTKELVDDWDKHQYEAFWSEFNAIMGRQWPAP